MPKKIYIRTFGCQMNVRDSEIILGMLKQRGYALAETAEEADVILFNTCSVRQHAEERVWGQVGMMRKLKTKGSSLSLRTDKRPVIGVVGCMAQNYQDEIFRRMPHVDLVCGPANIYDVPDLVQRALGAEPRILAVDKKQRPLDEEPDCRENNLKAFVSIMYGCDNFCSYCIVPYVRGKEISRPPRQILDEIKQLVEAGYKEVTLLGQNVNSYGKDLGGKLNFVRLLEKVNRINDLERIRFMTSHPKDASLKLFRAMCDLPRVCKELHLPLQSGSDKILKLMNRKYTLAEYLKKIDCLRSLIPNCKISTDIIVGFPAETEADFGKTKEAMQRIRFDWAFIFKYSPRAKTRAAQLKDNVPWKVKQARNQILLELQKEISLAKNNRRTQCLKS